MQIVKEKAIAVTVSAIMVQIVFVRNKSIKVPRRSEKVVTLEWNPFDVTLLPQCFNGKKAKKESE